MNLEHLNCIDSLKKLNLYTGFRLLGTLTIIPSSINLLKPSIYVILIWNNCLYWCLCQIIVFKSGHLFVFMLSDQIRSVAQSCPTLCNPMNHSTPGLPVHHQFLEFTQTHIHWVSDAIQPSHPLLSPSPLAPNPSQHQSLFQWVNSSHEVAKLLEFQL